MSRGQDGMVKGLVLAPAPRGATEGSRLRRTTLAADDRNGSSDAVSLKTSLGEAAGRAGAGVWADGHGRGAMPGEPTALEAPHRRILDRGAG